MSEPSYPRLANYYLSWELNLEEARELARWDLLILDAEAGVNDPEAIREIKNAHPNIIILAYLSSIEARHDIAGNPTARLRQSMLNQIQEDWWLKDISGGRQSFWPRAYLLNPASAWQDFLPQFVNEEILSSGLWDGVFYDNLWAEPSWSVSLETDLNGDGIAESADALNQGWQAGMQAVLSRSRELFGDNYLIVANGRGFAGYQDKLNGLMIENFPKIWSPDGEWTGSMQAYFDFSQLHQEPKVFVINANTANSGRIDAQAMRYGLASTLLGDGFYSYDHGTEHHGDTWWFDEYDLKLGQPQGPAYSLGGQADFSPGLWRRDFTNGAVIVNSGLESQGIDVSREALTFVDGAKAGQFMLAPAEAVILQGSPSFHADNREMGEIRMIGKDQGFVGEMRDDQGDSFAERVVQDVDFRFGAPLFEQPAAYPQESVPGPSRAGLEPFIPVASGAQVIHTYLDFDEYRETIVSEQGEIQVFKGERRVLTFYPYTKDYRGPVSFDVADLNGDGTKEIITAAGNGGGPFVRIFNYSGIPVTGGFFAYDKNFRGGVNVAVLDLNGDDTMEIITGAGSGGGPHIRTFTKDGEPLTAGFMAYEENARHGVSVAAGDVALDENKEIVTAPGPGGEPVIKIFDRDGRFINSFRDDRLGTGGANLVIQKNEVVGEKDVIFSSPY